MQKETTPKSALQVRQGTIKSVQDRFLAMLCQKRLSVCIYLVNGIKLYGTMKAFDQYSIYLDEPITQIIYKHSICSILPTIPSLKPEITNEPNTLKQ